MIYKYIYAHDDGTMDNIMLKICAINIYSLLYYEKKYDSCNLIRFRIADITWFFHLALIVLTKHYFIVYTKFFCVYLIRKLCYFLPNSKF